MMWKCTWNTAWCASAPLFCSTLYALAPVACSTARATRGSARPRAAADSSDNWSSVAAGSLGMTSVCPRDRGPMSRNAKTLSSS